NSGRPIWFLVYKRARYGVSRAGFWHTCTTVDGFLSGYLPHTKTDLGEASPSFTVSDVEELCDQSVDMEAEIGASFPGFTHPEYRWTLKLMFRPYMKNIEANRNEDIDSHGISEDSRVVPIVIHPRVNRPAGDWYVYTRLAGQDRKSTRLNSSHVSISY